MNSEDFETEMNDLGDRLMAMRLEADSLRRRIDGDDDDGGCFVREPRRPLPAAPARAMALSFA